ncbi:hypothetical protein [Anaerobranca gottschalkii]|uniref:Uncharacterized protein n=1 Tax=Anaerobranca gottschalkii DSM 13577 TaxID=1120990 RepID=A0A1I0C381_9FIRM|nr:hypothetical protein [Anaerobranca gottschalkii]SET13797.1 hypothetical protein SAMN03080614_105614 [Anaerobranca gottschalkii DSM 13577]
MEIRAPQSSNRNDELIERIAAWIAKKELQVPAVLYLEIHKPLAGVASAFISFLAPGLDWILGEKRMEDLANLLQDRREVERLIARIEEYK